MSEDVLIQYLIAIQLALIIPLMLVLIYKLSKRKSDNKEKTVIKVDNGDQNLSNTDGNLPEINNVEGQKADNVDINECGMYFFS